MSLATPRRSAPVTPTAAVSTRADVDDDHEESIDASHDSLVHVESECVVALKRSRENELDATVPSPSASKRARIRTPTPTPTPSSTPTPTPTLVRTPTPTPMSSETPTPSPTSPTPASMGVAVVESVDITVAVDAPSTPRRASSPLPSSLPRSPASSSALSTPPQPALSISTPSPASPATPKGGLSTPSSAAQRAALYRQRAGATRLRIETPHIPLGLESATRRSQITPPPSDRMLDRRNPPQPPRKAKKRRRLLSGASADRTDSGSPPPPLMISPARVPIARLPRLTSEGSTSQSAADASPTATFSLLAPPPSRVFRSLEAEFDAVADDPPLPLRLRSPPTIPRVTRLLPASSAFPGNTDPTITEAVGSPSVVRVKPRATRVHSVHANGNGNGSGNGNGAATSSPSARTIAVEEPQLG